MLALAFFLFDGGSISRGEESRRRALRDEIDRLLSDIAGELRDVPGDSSASDVERTMGYVDSVASKASDLKDHVDGDSDARRIVDYYPTYAGRYKEAARYLRDLKNGQKALDEYPRKCEDTVKDLASRLRAYTDTHDPRGVDEVPRLANDLGRVGKDALEQAERKKYEMSQWYERANYFSDSDGKWSDVRSNLQSTNRAIWDYFTRAHEQMKRDDVCGNLAKIERNPLVEEAMRKLFEGKKGIELIYQQLDGQLGEVAGNMRNLKDASSTSDIDYAERKADEIDRSLEQLDRIRGNDGEARRRVELHRNIGRAFREAMKPTRVLKQGQTLVDRAPERCAEAEANLDGVIRGYVDRRDPKGITQIPTRAREIGETIRAALAKADEQHRIMESARNEALRFDPSEGRWREVASNHKGSVSGIWDYWQRAWSTAHARCDELAKGEGHSKVPAAIRTLGEQASSAIDVFRRDAAAWQSDASSLFRLDCDALRSIWTAFCGSDEERNEAPDRETARGVARGIAATMVPKVGDMLSRYAELKKRGDELAAENETRDRANAILGKMKEFADKFERIKQRGSLRGADHPLSQFSMEYGKQMHDSMASSYSCTVYDQPFDGAGGRPDCIVASKCMVYEFKPNNSAAISLGRDQLGRYVPAVTTYYGNLIRDGGNAESSKGGSGIIETLKKNCMSGGALVFLNEVRTYDMCKQEYVCEE